MRRLDLPEETRPPCERIILVLVLGRLLDERVEVQVPDGPTGDPHESRAGDTWVGDHTRDLLLSGE